MAIEKCDITVVNYSYNTGLPYKDKVRIAMEMRRVAASTIASSRDWHIIRYNIDIDISFLRYEIFNYTLNDTVCFPET